MKFEKWIFKLNDANKLHCVYLNLSLFCFQLKEIICSNNHLKYD